MRRPVRVLVLAIMTALIVPVGSVGAAGPGPVVAVAPNAPAAPNAASPRFESMSCPPDVFPPEATVDCGFVTVPEDRTHPKGRKIRVAAAVMRASTPHAGADPIVFVTGGPSVGAISAFSVDFYFGGASYAEDRDIVLMDTRGTGLSEPYLGCPELDQANVDAFYTKSGINHDVKRIFGKAIAACRARLVGEGIDLAAYDTAESAADLDALRKALGYRTWNLIALSADGVLGLTYMRLFPKSIRSVIIDSGTSTQHLWDLDIQRGFSEELDKIFAGCAANAACEAAYPHIADVFDAFAAQLNAHPVTISFPDFQPQPVKLRLDGAGFFADTVGGIFPGNLFEAGNILNLLDETWRAMHGELEAVYRDRFGTGPVENDHANDFVAQGKTMSYACHDLVGFITKADLRAAARDIPALAPLFLDPDYSLADGSSNVTSPAGCRIWDVGVADPIQHRRVSSSIPTLVLAGEYDIGIPPYVVRQVTAGLRHSFYYEFPAAAHIQLASFNVDGECARSIAGQFLEHPGRTPDSSCIGSLAPFDFTP